MFRGRAARAGTDDGRGMSRKNHFREKQTLSRRRERVGCWGARGGVKAVQSGWEAVGSGRKKRVEGQPTLPGYETQIIKLLQRTC